METQTNKSAVLVVACAAQFMVVLDIAIVNVALPSIQQDLHVERGTLQWVVRALGIFGAVTGVSASVGVIASGLLTDGPGWRWVFLINVPIGVLLIATSVTCLPTAATSLRRDRFDVLGAVTLTGGLLLLVYGLNRGVDHGWGSLATVGLLVASAVLFVVFVAVESGSAAPLVPGHVLRSRTLIAANVSAFFTFGAFFSFIFLVSLMMQQVLGYSATHTGVAWLATTVVSFFAAAITGGKLVALVGVRRLLITGQVLLALAVVLMARVPVGGGYVTNLLPSLLLAGVAGGIAAPAAQIGALSGVADTLMGLASGLVETTREIGGAIGVAVVSTVLVSRTGVDAFHAAFYVISVVAALGALTAAFSFPGKATPRVGETGSLVPPPADPEHLDVV